VYRGPDRQQQRNTFRTRGEAIEGKRIAARRVALAKVLTGAQDGDDRRRSGW
jgi:hypothetical protein